MTYIIENREKLLAEIAQNANKRLSRVAKSVGSSFPAVLRNDTTHSFYYLNNMYYILTYNDKHHREDIEARTRRKIIPHPGLISLSTADSCAFNISNNSNSFLLNCYVKDMYSLYLGRNASVVLQNHVQELYIKEIGHIKYTVQLGYVISFGEEEPLLNLQSRLFDAISFSINKWVPPRAKK